MGDVDPSTLRDFVISIVFIGGFVLGVIRTVYATKPRPTLGENNASISVRLANIEHELDATKTRLARHEDKISRQVGAIHERINEIYGQLREIVGSLKTHMESQK